MNDNNNNNHAFVPCKAFHAHDALPYVKRYLVCRNERVDAFRLYHFSMNRSHSKVGQSGRIFLWSVISS